MSTDSTAATELVDAFDEFLGRYYHEALGELVQRYPQEQRSLNIDYMDLFSYDPDLADDFRKNPRQILEYLEEAVANYDLPVDVTMDAVTVRVENVPDSYTYDVGAYRSDQIGSYIGVAGQVSKMTEVKPKAVTVTFVCQRCGTPTTVPQSDTDGLQEPHECSGCERQGPFDINYERSEFVDHQLVRLQQPPEKTKGGDSATVDIYLEGDAVGTLDAGDRVTVGGIMSIDEPSDSEVAFDPYLDGRAISIEETDYADIDIDEHLDDILELANGDRGDPYELLIESIAPKVEGYTQIKEAIVLQMFGGNRLEYPDGSHARGDPHILLIGDPGTAKSTLLEKVEQKSPRSTYASGKGARAAGLTAAAVKDDFSGQQWTLDAGALVLADKGIACIDEIDKVDENAIESLHEALSKQKVHINKAGINAHLPTRTALLAAGNPKRGRFDPHEPIADQIDLGPTMLSRFDLLFMVDDEPDAERDKQIVDGMIDSRATAAAYTADPHDVDDEQLAKIEPEVPTDLFRAWIAYAKQSVTPRIRDEQVKDELRSSFTSLRLANGSDEDAPVPVTFRRLEGIQRLAEASASVRLSDTVEMCDIDRAKRLIGRSMRDVGMDPESGQFDADIVETGQSQSQKDRRTDLLQLISSLAMDHASGAPHEKVMEAAMDRGWGKSQTKYDLKKMKKQGEIYEPESDHYRTTKS